MVTGTLLVVANLKADSSFPTEEARARAFVDGGHGGRATYFNLAKKLKPCAAAPAIKVQGRPPSISPPAPLNIQDLLRQRFGRLGEG